MDEWEVSRMQDQKAFDQMVVKCNAEAVAARSMAAARGGGRCAAGEMAVRRVAKACERGSRANNDGHGIHHGRNGRGYGSGGRTSRDGDSSGMFCQSDDPHQHMSGLPSPLAINYDL